MDQFDGVPAPSKKKTALYPLQDIELGKFIFVPNGDIRRISSNVAFAVKHRQGCTHKKFVCRTIEHQGQKGVAIYRVPHPIFDSPEYLETKRQEQETSRQRRKERHARGIFYDGEIRPGEPGYEE